jgi:hypothetical protein
VGVGCWYLGSCFITGYVASKLGRSGLVWFALAIFFSPLTGLLALATLPREQNR